MAEFTGERVIPGQVDVDLWNEHFARYAFATRLARKRRVLDAGCGAGYGSSELAQTAASVIAIDVAATAVNYARANYAAANLTFLQASCSQIPFRDASFDLIVSFEVIEHLHDWQNLLTEARRLLAPGGQFIVSTPNKSYYAESRKLSGPNPYHDHEFTLEEFREALAAVFPHVAMFAQNHVEGVVLRPLAGGDGADIRVAAASHSPEDSHFFLAVCALSAQTGSPTFVYLPQTANVLRERELHIERLEQELNTKNQWLADAQREHQALLDVHRTQKAELEKSNLWAAKLDARVVALQDELKAEQAAGREVAAGYEAKVAELEAEVCRRTEWARETETRLTIEIQDRSVELARAVELLHAAEATIEERTLWAQRLDKDLDELTTRLSMVRASRWVRVGRILGLGPDLRNQ